MTDVAIPRTIADLQDNARRVADHTRQQIVTRSVEIDPDRPVELAIALASAFDELSDALRGSAGTDALTALPLCDLLTEIVELQQDLRDYSTKVRFRALDRIHASLNRLREIQTIPELLSEAPAELCHACDFDRAFLSRVRGSTWVPEQVCIAAGQDPHVTANTEEYLAQAEIPLSPMLLETELARRGTPALVTDPLGDPRTYKDFVTVTQTQAYVAAPIMPTGRVIGFLHADCFGSGRELDTHDRDNIWSFADGFGLIFERMVLLERLEEQRGEVQNAFRLAAEQIDGLVESEVRLSFQRRDRPGQNAKGPLVLGAESRLFTLLTAREREVLQIMVSGARNNQIADQLVISEGTVKSHVKNICRKLRASNRAEAVAKYLQLVMKEQR